MTGDNVGRDQLRDLIASPDMRLGYVLHAIENCRGISPRALARAVYLASSVLRTDYSVAKVIIRRAWVGQEAYRHLIGPLNDNIVGHVYLCSSDAMPGMVKIGFSTNVPRRMDQLRRIHGAPMNLIRTAEGTMLDEWSWQCGYRQHRIVGEWFSDAILEDAA